MFIKLSMGRGPDKHIFNPSIKVSKLQRGGNTKSRNHITYWWICFITQTREQTQCWFCSPPSPWIPDIDCPFWLDTPLAMLDLIFWLTLCALLLYGFFEKGIYTNNTYQNTTTPVLHNKCKSSTIRREVAIQPRCSDVMFVCKRDFMGFHQICYKIAMIKNGSNLKHR